MVSIAIVDNDYRGRKVRRAPTEFLQEQDDLPPLPTDDYDVGVG